MTSEIVPTQTLIPGVELIYLEDRDVAGIHIRGLARLLDCHQQTVANAVEGVNLDQVLEVGIDTGSGFQGVKFILESGVIQVLESIMDGKNKKETKDSARDLYRRFAVAGFKLYTMLKVAPEALKAKVDRHIEELEILRIKNRIAENEAIKAKAEQAVLDLRHYVVTALPEPAQQKIFGYSTVDKIEYRDRIIQNKDVIRDGSTINKTEMCRRLNFITKSGAADYKKLNKFLESADIPGEAWKFVAYLGKNEELDLIHWQEVERKWMNSDRNLYLGE